MLTPQEIQDKKFEKAVFGGYDMGQTDQFLDDILVDYTALYKENAALKAKMRVLVDKIDEYRAVDEEMRKALFTAQVTARDIVEKAQREADALVSNAHSDAQRRVTDMQKETEDEQRRLDAAKSACSEYAGKIRALLEKNIQVMETIMERPAEDYRADASDFGQDITAPPAAEPAPEPVSTDTRFFEVSLGDEEPEPPEEPADESDTAKIYGASPYTPGPRFNFSDLRFGKGYKDEEEQEKE